MPKVIITGATGMLGRALVKEFKKTKTVEGGDWDVVGTGYSRIEKDYIDSDGVKWKKINLTDPSALETFLKEENADVLFHCAAERRPDVVAQDEKAALQINVNSTTDLARLCSKFGTWLVFISSDYVFDGVSPPYSTNAQRKPLNSYGEMKMQAEDLIKKQMKDCGILRVPLLFGYVDDLKESNVTNLVNTIWKKEEAKLDDRNIRFPTFTDDVAFSCAGLANRKIQHCGLSGTFHCSGNTSFTYYTAAKKIGELIGESTDHILPKKDADPTRPVNSQLNCIALEAAGLLKQTPFDEAIQKVIKDYKDKH